MIQNKLTEYFKDEVRSGFYVPTAIKQAWFAGLSVLAEIDRICKKHNIMYYAEWGTLLGAVRHGGFIPWDDDLDIGMRREDYNKFRAVADAELPKEFVIHDYERHKNHWFFLSRVVNREYICFEEEHLRKYHNYPYMASVDIFVVDYLYKDEKKERERCDEIMQIIALTEALVENNIPITALEAQINDIENRYGITINRNLTPDEIGIMLYKLAEQQMARVPETDSERMGQIFPWVIKGNNGLPKSLYADTVRLPFENTQIAVLTGYAEILNSKYHNCFEVRKVWTGHDYPYFEKQKQALKDVSASVFSEFSYNNELDIRNTSGDTLRDLAEACVYELLKMTEAISLTDNYAVLAELLSECQQLAVDYANLVESVKGEHNPCTIRLVEAVQSYCDELYNIFNIINMDSNSETITFENIKEIVSNINTITQEYILQKKMVLFVTIGAREWKGFEKVYIEHLDKNDDIYVLPLPLLPKNPFGIVECSAEEADIEVHRELYPKELLLSDWKNLNLELLHPDIVYIQNPYDGENPCLTIPDKYYCINLKQHSAKVIYIPAFKVEEFTDKDTTTIYNMKHYVTAPGVVYADEIWVQSENMRIRYLEKLIEFAGEETKEIWQNKLVVFSYNREESVKNTGKKHLIFGIGLNELAEKGSNLIEKLNEKLEIIHSTNILAVDKALQIDVCLYPKDVKVWRQVDTALYEQVCNILKKAENNGIISIYTGEISVDMIDKYDAYYGSPSPMVHWFNNAKYPVMLWN